MIARSNNLGEWLMGRREAVFANQIHNHGLKMLQNTHQQ